MLKMPSDLWRFDFFVKNVYKINPAAIRIIICLFMISSLDSTLSSAVSLAQLCSFSRLALPCLSLSSPASLLSSRLSDQLFLFIDWTHRTKHRYIYYNETYRVFQKTQPTLSWMISPHFPVLCGSHINSRGLYLLGIWSVRLSPN